MRQAESRIGHRVEMRFAGIADRPFARAVAAQEAGLIGAIIMLQRFGDPVGARRRAERPAGAGHQQYLGIAPEHSRAPRGLALAETAAYGRTSGRAKG